MPDSALELFRLKKALPWTQDGTFLKLFALSPHEPSKECDAGSSLTPIARSDDAHSLRMTFMLMTHYYSLQFLRLSNTGLDQ